MKYKYSIIMPYIDRRLQLYTTLTSFIFNYHERDDYEIILIEDSKNNDGVLLQSMLNSFKEQGLNIIHVNSNLLDCYNPAPLFNMGAKFTFGDFLILTSPECSHDSNILEGLDEEFDCSDRKGKYIICACKSQGTKLEWYQHSVHRNKQYHFCSALSKELFNEVGGFDAEYGLGIGYDDDDFIKTIREHNTLIINRDDLIVYHQKHKKLSVEVEGYVDKLYRNRDYYRKKWKEKIVD